MTEFKKLVGVRDALVAIAHQLFTIDEDRLSTAIGPESPPPEETTTSSTSLAPSVPANAPSDGAEFDGVFAPNVEQIAGSIQQAHDMLDHARELIESAKPRIEKLSTKAKETVPERQIYNERMCAKILHLQKQLDAYFHAFSGPIITLVGDQYNTFVESLVRTAEWQHQIVSSIADVERREGEARAAIHSAAQSDAAAIRSHESNEKATLFRLRREREEEKWGQEQKRRTIEMSNTRRAVAEHSPLELVSIHCAALEGMGSATGTLRSLSELVTALVRTPETPEIRTLKNSHPAVIRNFGHPGAKSLREKYMHCEAILNSIGFRPEYTYSSAVTADETVPPVGIEQQGEYTMIGYEGYGERQLVLCEPDPAQDSAAWCEWYSVMQTVQQYLQKYD